MSAHGITLTQEQEDILYYIENNPGHVFVTGRAGTGKTAVLRAFRDRTSKNIRVVAPTGIAALNASGSTIHNLVGMGTGLPADAGIDMFKIKSKRGYMKELDALVIDEISMVNADMMDTMDRMLQFIRNKNEPFGGLQIIMFGDIYQLPPVVTDETRPYFAQSNYKSEWFFDAEVWQRWDTFQTFELRHIHRQNDPEFKELLNAVRDGTATQGHMDAINEIGANNKKGKKSMLLGSTRKIVEDRNHQNLTKLKGRAIEYKARVSTGFGRNEPADRVLKLKPGAQIMMLTNDRQERWVNGTQGKVLDCTSEWIKVLLTDAMTGDEDEYTVDRASWVPAGTAPEDYPVAPKFVQFPMKLAWGVTVHKSQGLSLREIEVNMGRGAFSPGQTYVALSRVTTPGGLFLPTPLNLSDVKVDSNVRRFFDSL